MIRERLFWMSVRTFSCWAAYMCGFIRGGVMRRLKNEDPHMTIYTWTEEDWAVWFLKLADPEYRPARALDVGSKS
jgi:hypothetical protein